MKNITYLFFLCGVIFSLQAQKTQQIFKWEAQTLSGGAFIGITNTKRDALFIIEQLMYKTSSDKGIVDFEIRFASTPSSTSSSIFDKFISYSNKKLLYTFLNREDIEAIRVYKNKGKDKCIAYFENATEFMDKKTMLDYLENDVLVFEKFLFFEQESKSKPINTYSSY